MSKNPAPQIIPVLLCGGSGSRLYPLSTPGRPKQFIPMFEDGSSLLRHALLRASLLSERCILVADAAHDEHIGREMKASGVAAETLLEALPQNTALAAMLGALATIEMTPGALICLMPCDHVIMDMEAFAAQMREAAEYAASGHIVLFGAPAVPSEQYGFIIRTPLMIGEGGFYPVEAFTEKPVLARARSLIETGRSYINSGIFLLQAGRLITEMRLQQPVLYTRALAMLKASAVHPLGRLIPPDRLEQEALPLDKAVIEEAGALVVAPAKFDWADVGSKQVLKEVVGRNASISAHVRGFFALEEASEMA